MECIGCGNEEGVKTLFVEELPCKHCGGGIGVAYNVCTSCGMAWRSVDGEPMLESTVFDMNELDGVFDDYDDLPDIAINMTHKSTESYMSDYVHKCLRCNSVCYQSGDNKFECPDCGFGWEIIKADG